MDQSNIEYKLEKRIMKNFENYMDTPTHFMNDSIEEHYKIIQTAKNQLIHKIITLQSKICMTLFRFPDLICDYTDLFSLINSFFINYQKIRTFHEAQTLLIPILIEIVAELQKNQIEELNDEIREMKSLKNSFIFFVNSIDQQKAPFNIKKSSFFHNFSIFVPNYTLSLKFNLMKYKTYLSILHSAEIIRFNERIPEISLFNIGSIVSDIFSKIIQLPFNNNVNKILSRIIELPKDFQNIYEFLSFLYTSSLTDQELSKLTVSINDKLSLVELAFNSISNLGISGLIDSSTIYILSSIFSLVNMLNDKLELQKFSNYFSQINIFEIPDDLPNIIIDLSETIKNTLQNVAFSYIFDEIPKNLDKNSIKILINMAFHGISTDIFKDLSFISIDSSNFGWFSKLFSFIMEISCLRALDKLTTPKQYQEISKPWLSVLISSSFDVNQNHRISNLLNSISNSSESLEYLVASVSELISDLNEEEISKLSNLLKTINKNKDDSLIDIYNEMKSFVELQRLPETSFLENQIQNIQKYVEFYSNFINSIVNNDPIDTMLFISSQFYSFSEIFENSKINLMKINIKTMISKIIGVNADIQIIITAIKAVVSLLNENSNNKYEFLSSKVNRLEKSVFTDYITGSVYDFVSKLPKFDILNQDFDFSYIRDTFVRESIKQECSKYKDNPNLRTSLSFNLSSKVLSINTPEITELSYTFVLLELSEGLAKRLNIPFNFSQKNFEKSFVIDKKPELLQDQTVVHEEPIHFQFANEKRKAPKFDFQIDPLDDREFNIQNESLMINDAFGENAERITDIIHFVENNF